MTLGAEGIPDAAKNAVLNANYLKSKLTGVYDMAYDGLCMHEFVISLDRQKKERGITAMDIAKTLLDYGMHPPTMYFPLLVSEALMVEPTETESKDTLDTAANLYRKILELPPDVLHASPSRAPIGRPDEVQAARNPILRYRFS